ncbi:MAG: hypothetical protein IJ411_02210 [Oscillospiraceae bacterium]|nr:hypothetical protein [Oscillospiraceae bacterium]
MNWKKEAVNQLKEYPNRKDSLQSIKSRCRLLEEETTALKERELPLPLRGALSTAQDQLLSSTAEQKQLQANYHMAKLQLQWIEKGLSALDEDERMVLEGFYMIGGPCIKQDLMSDLCIERSALYELKERALRKFTMSMYGLLES